MNGQGRRERKNFGLNGQKKSSRKAIFYRIFRIDETEKSSRARHASSEECGVYRSTPQ
jgi:hypothetical protein